MKTKYELTVYQGWTRCLVSSSLCQDSQSHDPYILLGFKSNKRRAKEILHPLLYVGGNMVTKDEEKAKLFNAFFVSVFSSKNSCSPGVQSPDWKTEKVP